MRTSYSNTSAIIRSGIPSNDFKHTLRNIRVDVY